MRYSQDIALPKGKRRFILDNGRISKPNELLNLKIKDIISKYR